MDDPCFVKTITLRDVWQILTRRIWLIGLMSLGCVVLTFIGNSLLFTPEYASTATLYILRQDEGMVQEQAAADFSLALNVVNDCTYLLKSHAVLDEVIDALGLNVPYETLSEAISASNPADTRILEVTVLGNSPQDAKAIVDMVCTVGAERIESAMGFRQVNLYEYGTLEQTPCNRLQPVIYLLVAIVAAIGVCAVLTLKLLLDDTIYSTEDVERYTEMNLLGSIPTAGQMKKACSRRPQNSAEREVYRTIRAAMRLYGADKRVIAFTGSCERERVTEIVQRLAKSLVKLEYSVLMIDGDFYNSPRSGAGLSDVLAGLCSPEACIYPGEGEKFCCMTAGRTMQNLPELLDSNRLSFLLGRLRKRYDYILVNAPRMKTTVDGAMVCVQCDGAVFILEKGKATCRQTRKSAMGLRRCGCELIGAIGYGLRT